MLIVVLARQPVHPQEPVLAMYIERGAGHSRGRPAPSAPAGTLFAQPGDSLILDATLGGAARAEFRVYREDRELVLRCPPGCARKGMRLYGSVVLPAIGKYEVYLVTSAHGLPEPAPMMAEDTERLLQAGARIILGQPVHVY